MKKAKLLLVGLSVFAIAFLYACGGSTPAPEATQEENTEEVAPEAAPEVAVEGEVPAAEETPAAQ
jgi:hypothetical protein